MLDLYFPSSNISVVPVCANIADNIDGLLPESPLSSWYSGNSLLDAIDQLPRCQRPLNKHLRAILTSVVSENPRGCDVAVKVMQGRLVLNRSVGIVGANGKDASLSSATVKRIQHTSEEVVSGTQILNAGESGTIRLVDK